MAAPRTIGKYEIVGELGKGAMGVVYKGYDPVIRRYVALKVLHKSELEPRTSAEIVERFKREAQAAGNLNHSNIVAVYEYGEDGDLAFIAMECVIGKSLRDHLVSGYRPELKFFPEILDHLLQGLEYSHSRGVIHRDIKPANLLVSEMGVAKISDFGIARLEHSHLTMLGEVLGTPYYMSPEQFNGQPADERSDIYSAAVIVYEVLTGHRPFEGQGGALMKKILEEEPVAPSQLEPRLSPDVDRVVLKGLAKDPARRFRSARQFLEALHLAFEGKPLPERFGAGGEQDTTVPGERTGESSGTLVTRPAVANVGAFRRAAGAAGPSGGARAGDEQNRAAGDVRRPRLLFVDDEERVVDALRAVFRGHYEVDTALNGAEALALLRERSYHVIVSDQRMPGMLGVDLLREVKTMAPNTVRLLLTGYSDLASIVGSVNEGEVYRFVSKPWNQDDLQATIAEAVTISIALEASPPPRASAKGDQDLVVLVLDDAPMARATREMVGDLCRVVHAPTLDDALHALAVSEVAVLVADLESQRVDNTVLFKLLKKEHPQTLVIVTTRASDSELIISLINEARIFRFINKPVNFTLLQTHIVAALERYWNFKQAPQLVKSERPKASAREVEESALGQSILTRLRSIGGRFAAVFGRG